MSESLAALPEPDRLLQRARAWLEGDPDPETRAELEALIEGDRGDLSERFAGPLEFGTAGLRALVGAGESRINRAVVIRATKGLADFLVSRRSGARNLPVVIGYDARPESLRFAADAAGVFLAMGIPVRVFEGEVPTPLVAYTARRLGAIAAVMVTASHNPRGYNGFKVYLDDAVQLVSPVDAEIAAFIDAVGPAKGVPRLEIPSDPRSLSTAAGPIPAEFFEWYLDEIAVDLPAFGPSALGIAYTPLHGVGGRFAQRAFEKAGFSGLKVVPSQIKPDGTFPTTPFPNPEEKGSLDAALELARAEGAELVIANDPDADRLGAAVRTPSGLYRALSGNQIGILLADAMLEHAREGRVQNPLVVASVVSSPMVEKLVRARGARFESTLTGFKWIWTAALALTRDARDDFVFGFEEALGYSVSNAVRDKDGISAALALARFAARLHDEQKSLLDRLGELYREHGLWVSAQHNVVRLGSRGAVEIRSAVDRLVQAQPREVDSQVIVEIRDLRSGRHEHPWKGPTDMVELRLAGGGRVLVRPSGTEPKLKIYIDLEIPLSTTEPWSSAEERGIERAQAIGRAVEAALGFSE